MSNDVDWSRQSPAIVSDDADRMAVAAHALLGGIAAVRGAVQLAMVTEPIGTSRDSLLMLAVRRLDVMTEQLRNLASGVPEEALALLDDLFDDRASLDLREGTRIELHSTFNNSWITGFEIAESVNGGYRVRRASDGSLLPGFTSADDLRAVPSGRHS
jgi:hypothetical protein